MGKGPFGWRRSGQRYFGVKADQPVTHGQQTEAVRGQRVRCEGHHGGGD